MKLSELTKDQKGIIIDIKGKTPFLIRLMELGFLLGCQVVCQRISPLNTAILVKIDDTSFMLRKQDAENLTVIEERL